MITILEHKDANVHVEHLPTGKKRIYVEQMNDGLFVPTRSCETSYPIGLIDKILELKGPAYLCDEILRDESPAYVEKALKYAMLAYLKEEALENKRLLDFGCGSGASTMVLARMFPRTEIVGIELEEELLSLAQLRAAHYGYENIQLMISPNPESLPLGIGNFDCVVLSAVYEHLLPNERKTVLPQIWSALNPGGILFLNQTPYRYSPVEMHTTGGLPIINYLPYRAACYYAQHFSKRNLKNSSWEELLREGIRGGSVKEIFGILTNCPGIPVLLSPSRFGMNDRIDIWYIQSRTARLAAMKRLLWVLFKLLERLTGITLVPSLSLAIKKAEQGIEAT